MKSSGLFLIGLLMLLVLPHVAATENIDVDFDAEPGQELVLDLGGARGTLDIEGWDQNRVRFEGRARGRGRRGRSDEVLVFDQSSDGIEVYAEHDSRDDDVDVRLTVRVPSEFDLRIRGAMETSVTGVRGRVDIGAGNADVELADVHGQCRIRTANGKLDIERCTLDGDISNTNGRLTIEDSEITGDVASTNSSMRLSRAPQGLDATSTNGNISVDSVRDHFRGRTTNGNVTIRELDGWIDTETVNGSVKVRLVGDPQGKRDVDIETLNGNVELEIPDSFSMDFDIEVRDSDRDEPGRYEIVSDFALDIDAGESRRGRRNRITGTGTLGDGRNRVRIRATNGDVILTKAR